MIIRGIDTETTGLDATDAVVEVATMDLIQDPATPHGWRRGPDWSSLVNPLRPIPVEAMGVHHITDDMVKDAPVWEQVTPRIQVPAEGCKISDGSMVLCAHFAKFDRQFVDFGARWIDTYKLALHFYPDCPVHKNQVLRYWLGLKLADEALAQPHRAAGDIYVTMAILSRMLREFGPSVDELVRISAEPALLPRLTFGKHAMIPIAEVPIDYLEWVVKNVTDDEDVQHTAKHQIHLRRQASRARGPVTATPPGQEPTR